MEMIDHKAKQRIRQLGHLLTDEFCLLSDCVYRCSACYMPGGWKEGRMELGPAGPIFNLVCPGGPPLACKSCFYIELSPLFAEEDGCPMCTKPLSELRSPR